MAIEMLTPVGTTQTKVNKTELDICSTLAIGTWSGGKFMHYGKPLNDEEFISMFRHAWEKGIRTFVSSDVYGKGEADCLLGKALSVFPRESYRLVGMIGHDFYSGKRVGNRGYPRFTDPQLRQEKDYALYLADAINRSLGRCGTDYFDSVLLHNPDEIGYTNEVVWQSLEEMKEVGKTLSVGIAPGPANGFVLDLIHTFRTYGDIIDSCMAILNPLEPWPIRYIFDECEAQNVEVITRVADYGGALFNYMKNDHLFANGDHRSYRPEGWVAEANSKISRMMEIAESHGLTSMQMSVAWALSQPSVSHVTPTLIREKDEDMQAVMERIDELVQTPVCHFSEAELTRISDIGDNQGCMPLKGASDRYEHGNRPDEWPLRPELQVIAAEIGWNTNW